MKRILLCTADEFFSRGLARLLRAAAYDVVAADGPGGLAHIERDAFDAVVTDLHMPGADGFAILDSVRAKAPQTPVIVLSGGAQIQDAMCAMRLGACDFVVKPVDVESLEKALGRALRRARPPTPNAGPDAVAWGSRTASTPTGTTDLRAKLKSVEDRMVAEALARTRGNKNRAAALLGLDRPSLLEELRRKQMEKQPPEHTSATACDKIASLSHTLFLLPLIIPEQVAEERIEAARTSNASELDLHGLGLTRLPPSIGQLTKLQSLNVFRNQLSALPNAIGNLSQLRFLYISENRLTALPAAIGRLSQLQFLSASENRLTALPEAIGRLSQLHHLNLCSNRLTALPKSLRRLAGLEKLFLQENPDLELPPNVLGPPLHCLPWGDARPADPTSILDYYFNTPVSGNRWLRLFRGLFAANRHNW